MKRVLPLILAAALTLSLAACGGENVSMPTKEELLETAQVVDYKELQSALQGNKVRAQETYVGNVYQYSGFVTAIEAEYVELDATIYVYLSSEELASLNVRERINVVGTIETADLLTQTFMMNKKDVPTIEMKNAYYVSNLIELSGTVQMGYMDVLNSSGQAFSGTGLELQWYLNICPPDRDEWGNAIRYSLKDAIPVEHIRGQDITAVTYLDETFSQDDTISIVCEMEYPQDTELMLNRDFYTFPGEEASASGHITSIESIQVE